MLDIVQNDQQRQLQQQQLEQQQLLLAQQQLVMQQMAQLQQPPLQPQVMPSQQLDQQPLLLAQQQMLLQQLAQQQQAVQPQVWTPQQQALTPPSMTLSPTDPSLACAPTTTTSPWGRPPVNPYWETPSANRAGNTAHAQRRNTVQSQSGEHGFYIGGFGGGTLLPADLWSLTERNVWFNGSADETKITLRQRAGYNIGFTLGYDFNSHWGLESRLHTMKMNIDGKWKMKEWDQWGNLIDDDAGVEKGLLKRTLTIFDVSAHYYPWGDVRCSPYFKAGLGYARQKYSGGFGSSDGVTMPVGVGLRYQWSPQIAFRVNLVDDILFKSKNNGFDIKTNHNLALSVGVTYSFGSGSVQPVRRY